jgi:4-hydroxythreonine-4-phosphate dehydrogenase
MGDPAGIGPEIILKYFQRTTGEIIQPVVIGYKKVFAEYQKTIPEVCNLPLKKITHPREYEKDALCIIEPGADEPEWAPGKISASSGAAAFACIDTAITLAMNAEIHGVTTAPIHKESLHKAGYTYPGHTEIFAEKTSSKNYTMMFYLDGVSVVHVTSHCSLRQALELIRPHRVYRNIRLLHDELTHLGRKNPAIAVAGLNPHAGENTIFGSEDREHILPAVIQAQNEGINVRGPLPPDTVFMNAFRGQFEGVVSMLHDHGFVALKSRDFEKGVNITVGLPIIRTSVGHGTAFDIAGKNAASPASLIAAVELAAKRASS